MRKFTLLLSLLMGLIAPALAQGTREEYTRANQFLPWNLRKLVLDADITPHWVGKSSRFWYREPKLGSEEKSFLLVDAARDTLGPAFDHARLASALEKATHRQYEASNLPFDSFDFVEEENAIRFEAEGKTWTCTLSNYECSSSRTPLGPRPSVSPDGSWVAFVRDYNLFVSSTETGQEIQLTRDGERDYDYATPLPMVGALINQDETERRPRPVGVSWSPDSRRLITYRIDSRYSGRFTTVQFAPPDQLRPRAFSAAYPLPGEAVARAEVMVFDLEAGKRVNIETDPLDILFVGGPSFTWFKDNRHFYFEYTERGYQRVELREADAITGKVRAVVSESAKNYVDPGTTFVRPVNDGAQFLWSSERDGWNHLYLYDRDAGQLKSQLTRGQWLVRSIVRVDDKAKQVYFLGAGREPGEDPYQTHLYRVNLDGTGLELLTPENANHTVAMSTGGEYFVDNYSRPDLPGKSVLRSAKDGKVIRVLGTTTADALVKLGWHFPEPFQGKARDGKTDIYGIIWRPTDFDASKKYAVIEQIYTGPQAFFVPKTFAAYRNNAQATAELGFIVVMIDGLGTGGRSRQFHDYCYKDLGDAGLPDHIALLKQMAAKYPYMDLNRVGVYGVSAGGYAAAHAILTHPEVYKVAVAISGNHDHRLDKAWWNELWMGYPVGKQYREQSNITLADKLQGHLLLVHGDVDDNVNVSSTLRFADALIKANKDFDLLIVPNQSHGEGTNTYITRRRWDYFVENLLAVQPPSGFQLDKAPASFLSQIRSASAEESPEAEEGPDQ